jgi:hypothetical protein
MCPIMQTKLFIYCLLKHNIYFSQESGCGIYYNEDIFELVEKSQQYGRKI